MRFQRSITILDIFPPCSNTVEMLKTFFKTFTVVILCCVILEVVSLEKLYVRLLVGTSLTVLKYCVY
jgi:hypothetical protein